MTSGISIKNSPSTLSMSSLRTLNEFGLTADNSLINYLIPEEKINSITKPQFTARQINNCHFTFVKPEPFTTKPYLVGASKRCAEDLGLNPQEFDRPLFLEAFTGNTLLPGLDTPYCTIYGCHCYGQWFGQLGDGRAMGLGEVQSSMSSQSSTGSSASNTADGSTSCSTRSTRMELQLKGCGRSPYSRGFDGRAVLRSSVREFLGK